MALGINSDWDEYPEYDSSDESLKDEIRELKNKLAQAKQFHDGHCALLDAGVECTAPWL